MGDHRENDSPESHEAKVSELAHAYAGALLRGDEIGAEIAQDGRVDHARGLTGRSSVCARHLSQRAGTPDVIALRVVDSLLL